jgi:hypothetical protein
LEETLKEFMELVGQPTIPVSQEPSLEGQLGHLVAEFNIPKEEEFKSQEMVKSEEVFKETVNEPSLKYPTLELQTEKGETTEISFPNSVFFISS